MTGPEDDEDPSVSPIIEFPPDDEDPEPWDAEASYDEDAEEPDEDDECEF